MGYTLNGYYLVNSSESAGQLGVTFCHFKLPPGAVKCKDMHDRQNYYVVLDIEICKILFYDDLQLRENNYLDSSIYSKRLTYHLMKQKVCFHLNLKYLILIV